MAAITDASTKQLPGSIHTEAVQNEYGNLTECIPVPGPHKSPDL